MTKIMPGRYACKEYPWNHYVMVNEELSEGNLNQTELVRVATKVTQTLDSCQSAGEPYQRIHCKPGCDVQNLVEPLNVLLRRKY